MCLVYKGSILDFIYVEVKCLNCNLGSYDCYKLD